MDPKRSADLILLINMIYIAAYGGGYCQETLHHITLLQILLLTAGPWQPAPALLSGRGHQGLSLGDPSHTWVSLGHIQARSSPALGSRFSCTKEMETSS